MDIIEESGYFWVSYSMEGATGIWTKTAKFTYSKVFWYDGFKFVMGSFSGDTIDRVVEVNSGALCVESIELKGKITVNSYIKKFLEKVDRSKKPIGRLVEEHNSNNNFKFKTWLSLLTP